MVQTAMTRAMRIPQPPMAQRSLGSQIGPARLIITGRAAACRKLETHIHCNSECVIKQQLGTLEVWGRSALTPTRSWLSWLSLFSGLGGKRGVRAGDVARVQAGAEASGLQGTES